MLLGRSCRSTTLSTVELATNPAEFGKLAARRILVEIAEACREEADGFTLEPAAVNATFTGDELVGIPPHSNLWK